MSKIICEVCGTTYPETASQCPICGCVRPADTNTVFSEADIDGKSGTGTYTYVKGGRFSKANVRKRTQTVPERKPSTAEKRSQKPASGNQDQEKKSDKGLVAVIVVLILLIIGVAIYLAKTYLLPEGLGPLTNPDGTTQGTEDTSQTPPPEIRCTDLQLSHSSYVMTAAGEGLLLSVKAEPADTTDTVTFETSDPNVVTVSASGNITAVAPGEATVTITCGDVVRYCYVTCEFETEPPATQTPPDPTEESTEPTVTEADLKLNRSDFTMSTQGETWMLYEGNIPADEVTWTSDDESIATIQNGKVVAVGGPGYTTVHGEYKGVKVSCIVRCSFTATSPGITGNGGVSEDGPSAGAFKINTNDVTIKVGESFLLQLRDSSGSLVSVNWIVENDATCSVAGNNVTGKAPGTTTVYVIHQGQRYTCIVRVHS